MGKSFIDSVLESLEKDKENYKHIVYDPKKNVMYCAKEIYNLMPQNTEWLRVYDGKIFGVDKRLKEHFMFIGEL